MALHHNGEAGAIHRMVNADHRCLYSLKSKALRERVKSFGTIQEQLVQIGSPLLGTAVLGSPTDPVGRHLHAISTVGRHPHADPGARMGPGVEVFGDSGRRQTPERSWRQGVAALRACRAEARPQQCSVRFLNRDLACSTKRSTAGFRIIVSGSRQSAGWSFRNLLQRASSTQRPHAFAEWFGTQVDLLFQLDPTAGCTDSFVDRPPIADYRIVPGLGERPQLLVGRREWRGRRPAAGPRISVYIDRCARSDDESQAQPERHPPAPSAHPLASARIMVGIRLSSADRVGGPLRLRCRWIARTSRPQYSARGRPARRGPVGHCVWPCPSQRQHGVFDRCSSP
jgi:hypothetical protein